MATTSSNCIAPKSKAREVWRDEHSELLEALRLRMEAHPDAMKERSALVEHPFGTLKRRAGWDHFLVRGLEKVRGEWSLMALAYNFTRVLNLIGLKGLMEYLVQQKRAISAFISTFVWLSIALRRLQALLSTPIGGFNPLRPIRQVAG